MALYADENFPLRVVEELRRLGHDVVTTLEDGRAINPLLTESCWKEQKKSVAQSSRSIVPISSACIFSYLNMQESLSVQKIRIGQVRRNEFRSQSPQRKYWLAN
ncbi:MAG TPA: DUF5615 family PIN-like protein [Pyrinomonadaceae bacterium]|nr:DUF5615 family PIN-like protein [Pyrinomonadaceae bacterium]